MQGDGAQQSPGHGACHHTHAETSAHEPEVASPIFPIGDVGDIGASNRTCGAGDAGHDASGVEDRDLDPAKLIRLTIGELWADNNSPLEIILFNFKKEIYHAEKDV